MSAIWNGILYYVGPIKSYDHLIQNEENLNENLSQENKSIVEERVYASGI